MKAEIKVDVPGQLRLFRSNTFVDPYAFIREAVQNAQRAKATELSVTTTQGGLVIQDNGPGMSNIEDLLTINRSGWDEKTVSEEEPFGIGFFSAFAMANKVVVESQGRSITLDYEKLLKDPSDIPVVALSESSPGFRITLSELVPEIEIYKINNTVRGVCSTIPSIKTTLNDTPVKVYSVLSPARPESALIPGPDRRDAGYRGWLDLAEYSWNSDLKIYHKGRYVTDLKLNGLKGCIDVDLSVLNLRAPDRQDIIQDDKYSKFIADLKELYIKPMLISQVTKERQSDSLRDVVSSYLKPEDYAGSLKYRRITNVEVIDKAAEMNETSLTYISESEFNDLFAESVTKVQGLGDSYQNLTDYRDVSFTPESEEYSSAHYGTPIEDQVRSVEQGGPGARYTDLGLSGIRKVKRSSYYVEPIDLKKNGDTIKAVIKAGCHVFVPQNKLEASVMKDFLGLHYLGNASIKTQVSYKIVSSKESIKARRISALLLVLLNRLYPAKENAVGYGALSRITSTMVDDKEISSETDSPAFGLQEGTIILNSSIVAKSNVVTISDSRSDISELRFLLLYLDDLGLILGASPSLICRELATLPVSWIVTNHIEDPGHDE